MGPRAQQDLGPSSISTEHVYPDWPGDTVRNQDDSKCHRTCLCPSPALPSSFSFKSMSEERTQTMIRKGTVQLHILKCVFIPKPSAENWAGPRGGLWSELSRSPADCSSSPRSLLSANSPRILGEQGQRLRMKERLPVPWVIQLPW